MEGARETSGFVKRGAPMTKLVNELASVQANEPLGPGLYLMALKAPQIARGIEAGQFVHMRIPHMDDHILRRPFSVYGRSAEEGIVEILYQTVGYGTDQMTRIGALESVEMIGPVGRPWRPPAAASRALLVAGGVGSAPLFLLAEKLIAEKREVDVVLGAQTAEALVSRERYEALLQAPPRCSTDDGSFGFEGFCTPLVEQALAEAEGEGRPYDYLAVCGPEPLMRLVANMAAEHGVLCEVSLERRMACGVGACLSCVVNTTGGLKRSCVDGPVFLAEEVIW